MNNRVKIYRMHTEELDNPGVFQEYYQKMPSERRSKIDAMRLQRDKKLSLGAGVLLDRGLKEYGLRVQDVRMETGENGKPYLPDYPEIHFNLSHSREMVLAVFADSEVGCDIEYMDAVNLKLARRFFCLSEYEYILAQKSEEDQKESFYRLWTLKESFMKATGLGMKLALDEFCFRLEDTVTVQQQVDNFNYEFTEYKFGDYRGAVCIRAKSGT